MDSLCYFFSLSFTSSNLFPPHSITVASRYKNIVERELLNAYSRKGEKMDRKNRVAVRTKSLVYGKSQYSSNF